MKHSLIALTSTALLGFAAPAFAADAAEVGKPAPAFKLKDEAGKEHSLEQYKGKVVVLEWTNPECPFVKRHYEADTMQKTQAGFDSKKVVWLTVDSSSHHTAQTAAEAKKAEGITNPVLLDTDGAVGHAYGAKTTPHMYVIDDKGVVRYSGAIDDDPRGKAEKAPTNYVKTAVDAILTGKPVPTSTTQPYGCSVKYKS
ncbi:thioredoxin family protein [Myxococcaceae bacterium GXIMD 01537]